LIRRFAIVLAVVGAVTVVPVVPSGATAIPLREDAVLRFPGHGWGHGRGMGQWGAYGMAQQGSSYSTIVKHYYSGVIFGARSSTEDIKILVEESPSVVVTSDSTFSIRWASNGSTAATSDATYKFFRVRWDGTYYVIDRATAWNGPWSKVKSSTSYAVFTPGSSLLQLIFDDGSVRYYRGKIIAHVSSGKMRSIDQATMQQYLYAVVPREMPASWPAEALKAQAVAARSYAAYKKDNARAAGTMFDICATTSCQVYGGYARKSSVSGTVTKLESSSSNTAVDATAGKVLTYSGKAILAEFSSSTGGYSAPGSVPYLKPVSDPADSVSPHHDWTGIVSVSQIEAAWPAIGHLVDVKVTKRDGYGSWGGRVLSMDIVGTSGTVTISGGTFSSKFYWPGMSNGLESNWFTVQRWDAAVASTPTVKTILPGQNLNVSLLYKNTGNVSWPVGGSVRLRAYSSSLSGPEWISSTRPTSLTANATDPSKTKVAPGEVGRFSFVLHSSSLAPGNYTQSFIPIAENITTMNQRVTVPFSVVQPYETPGLVRNAVWYENTAFDGTTEKSFTFGRSTDTPVVGDWDGNGTQTPGLVRGATWYLKNSNGPGAADVVFTFGRAGDIPIVGDWDGNGTETPGLVRGATWYLKNSSGPGAADVVFTFGRAGDVPVVGDWDGNKTDTPGAFRGGTWYLRNSNGSGGANITLQLGTTGDTPLAGDWGAFGRDAPAVVHDGTWKLTTDFDGVPRITFRYGRAGDRFVTGHWQNA